MTGILGRASEIAAIEDFLESRTDGARVLVLEGEPGIGKTTLWRWAAARAESHGVSVLRAQPTEAEQELAFAKALVLARLDHEPEPRQPRPQRLAVHRYAHAAAGAYLGRPPGR